MSFTMSEQQLCRPGLSDRELQALRRQEARKKRDDKRKLKASALVQNREFDGGEPERIPPVLPELRTKRELQALRRLEARKKRDDKRKLKANALAGRESDGGDLEQSRTRGNWDCNTSTKPFLVRPACTPAFVVGDQLKRAVSTCSRGSSSAASDYQSNSKQGGSNNNGGSHSSHSRPLDHTIKTCSTTLHHNPQLSRPKLNADSRLSTYRIEPVQIPNKVPSQTNSSHHDQSQMSTSKKKATKEDGLELEKNPNMPCVTTTGNGPNGKRIRGFLYNYTKSEVSIVCICHGTSFSPAGFVEHAGGVGIENPLTHIIVSPSASDHSSSTASFISN